MPDRLKTDKLNRLLTNIKRDYAPVVCVTRFGVEDMLLIDVICKYHPEIEIISIDTGRLAEETHTLMQQVKNHYQQAIKVFYPDPAELEDYVYRNGPNAFYDNVMQRKSCCQIRILGPLSRALKGKNSWISGTRIGAGFKHKDWDAIHDLPRFNPLCDWTRDEIWGYIHLHGVPFNVLHTKDYPIIGCKPCTRAVSDDTKIHSARWWWEQNGTQPNAASDSTLVKLT